MGGEGRRVIHLSLNAFSIFSAQRQDLQDVPARKTDRPILVPLQNAFYIVPPASPSTLVFSGTSPTKCHFSLLGLVGKGCFRT